MAQDQRPLVLLVEDLQTEIALVRAAVRACGLQWDLLVARDGREAMDRIEEGVVPRGIILDLGLPHVTGLEFLGWLRERPGRASTVPVVVYSALLDPARREASLALGAVRFVLKSEDFRELQELVRYVDGLVGGPARDATSA